MVITALSSVSLVIAAEPSSTPASTQVSNQSLLTQALSLAEKEPKKALQILDSIPPSSSGNEFQFVLEETLKLLYRLEDWTRFFALAQYYRLHLDPKKRSEIVLLEPLALLRHCQNDLVKAVAQVLKLEQKELSASLSQIESLAETRFKGKSTKKAVSALEPLLKHWSGETLWKTNPGKTENVDPRKLRVRLSSECSGS